MIDHLEGVSTDILTNKRLITVGFLLDIHCDKPAKIGTKLNYKTEVIGIKGNKVVFNTSVYDEDDGSLIGHGKHTRAIIGLE